MDTILNRITWYLCRLALALLLCGAALGDTALFRSRPVTRAGEYTFGIEGPAVDSAGNLYVDAAQHRSGIAAMASIDIQAMPYPSA
jgi:hypothetical protein